MSLSEFDSVTANLLLLTFYSMLLGGAAYSVMEAGFALAGQKKPKRRLSK